MQAHVPDDIDLPIQKEDFLSAAKELTGSRDLGAQLFCALLRAAGVDARLVCSLQPLEFRAVEKASTPQRKYAFTMPADPETREMPSESEDDRLSDSKTAVGSHGGKIRFTPEPGEGSSKNLPSRSKRQWPITGSCRLADDIKVPIKGPYVNHAIRFTGSKRSTKHPKSGYLLTHS